MTRKTPTARTRPRTAHTKEHATHLVNAEQQWGIIGNTNVVRRLQRMVMNGPDTHAFLLDGPSGIGKTTLATCFAKALVCSEPSAGTACGVCKNCTALSQHRHPDVISVTDGDDTVGIDRVRDVTSTLQRRPTLAVRHVVVIDRVERMTEEASNGFLKTLEEPYGGTVFILTTDNLHLVPPTIVSRCSVFHCTPVSEDAVKDCLAAAGITSTEARRIAAIADGRPAYALRLAQQQGAYERAIEDAESLLTLISAVPHERLRIAETIASHKEEPARMTAVIERWESTMRRMLRVAAGLPDHGPGAEAIRSLATSTMTLPAIMNLSRQLQIMRDRIRTSGNVRLNIESFSLHLPTTRL